MTDIRRDPVSGEMTTGHEWNGIEELETPVPRVIYFFLAVTILFSIVYWILMPAWPLGRTYTKGVLGDDQRADVTRAVAEAAETRAVWTDRITKADFAAIEADPALMRHVRETGRALFGDNCAACHGANGTGGPGYPDLAAGSWLWGGDPETLAQTIRAGINADDPDTRTAQMPDFGRNGTLQRAEVLDVAAYVRSLSGQALLPAEQARVPAGQVVFMANCTPCHGEDGKGNQAVGAPDLTDRHWIYGGDLQSVFTSIQDGRQGHMPAWERRLSPLEIKLLALYVAKLGEGRQ